MGLTLDTLDDRREVYHLLHRLPPARRVAFLADCCGRVTAPGGNRPAAAGFGRLVREAGRCDRGDERLTVAVYTDLLALAAQWRLDLAAAAVRLERWGRSSSSA